MKDIILYSAFLFLSSCFNANVKITNSYIHSDAFNTKSRGWVEISKIVLNDTSISVNNGKFDPFDLRKHTKDSTFCFFLEECNVENNKTVYFDRIQENITWRKCNDLNIVIKIIGKLENDTWYLINGINGTIEYYVFIDKSGESHLYSVNPSNW